ncbi:MAG: C4-type zinc ribbon domain-containing protein [Methylacidiphilales bacterium]|nr:C4-type zinc ribbon domain-containing protein [Candidatus Methylacidiphilales bacterium]
MTNSTVEALLVLQERDARVAALTSELGSLPRQIAAVDEEIAARKAKFDELKNRTRQIEADRKKIDLDVQAKQVAISRYKSQQQQTRKNEEFAALNHEIEHAEKEIAALEDSELELMEAYDKGLAAVAAAQKELLQFEEKAKHKKADLEKRAAAVSAELIGAEEKQAAAEQAVPEDVLPRYRRILKSKKDVAIVPIRHGACGGCHMKLTPQTVLTARAAEDLVSCDNCGRLVYWSDE